MRTVEQIEKDIEFVLKDIEQLVKMKASTYAAYLDLYELKKELQKAKEEKGN